VSAIFIGYKRWQEQDYLLNRMSLRDLVRAYFTYPAIQAYLALSVLCIAALAVVPVAPLPTAVAAVLAVLVYPLVWYLLHRYVLHGKYLYKSKYTAAVWKRIHFDHHQHPNDLSVLFGALYTTLPTIVIVTAPIGFAVAGASGALAAVAAGLLTTCFYEFCHCIQHLAYQPKNKTLQRMKKLHMAHHFHNEQGNYGITNFFWDRLFGTVYESPGKVARSATVRNLGYVEEEARRYPWVARLTGGGPSDGRCRDRKTAAANT
jgi:sterol desaturase/sphingolipid hydroxylase (fatty acid hydroxylase superfamily)